MKQVDFYLIGNTVHQARYKLASRLAKKLQGMEQSALIVVDHDDELNPLDEVLWVFSDTSFVAHDRVPSSDGTRSLTHIAKASEVSSEMLDKQYDVLISLTSEVQAFSHRFSRIAEIIESEESSKAAGRDRFRHYKTEGFELKTHNLEL